MVTRIGRSKTESTFTTVGNPEGGGGGRAKRSSIRRPQQSTACCKSLMNISYHSSDFKSLEGRNFRRKSLGGATLRLSTADPFHTPSRLAPSWAPKIAPRSPKIAPRSPQDGPRSPQEAPRSAQDAPGASQERPRAARSGPRAAQERQEAILDDFKINFRGILSSHCHQAEGPAAWGRPVKTYPGGFRHD